MNASILLLLVCFAALALLLLALCLHTRWPVWVKSSAIVVVSLFFYLNYDALTGVLGYAAPARLPDRFILHSVVFVQPNKNTGDKGAIYLWATALKKDGPVREPRAYELPFEKTTHEQLNESLKRSREGVVQLGVATESGPRDGAGLFARFLATGNHQRLKLQDLPDPALPEK